MGGREGGREVKRKGRMGGGLKRWADMVMGDGGSQRGGYT